MDFDGFVLAASTADLSVEPAARDHADAIEFRMDLAGDPLSALADYDGELPILATNRAKHEGGEAGGTDPNGPAEAARFDEIVEAIDVPAVEAVDLELGCIRTGDAGHVVDAAENAGVSVVASVHNFVETPSTDQLTEVLARAASAGDVGKLAVTATDRSDVLRLLSATDQLDRQGERVATMAMGAAGRHSRALSPLYGSKIGYAPVDPADATAPGQYDLETLADLVSTLQYPV